jgi:hypothetical protein
MYALDCMKNSTTLKGKIDKIVAETLDTEHHFLRKLWDLIGGHLCKGILSDSKYIDSSFSLGLKVIGSLNGIQ